MCTAITYQTNNQYFGRTLDLEYSYNEAVVVTPRRFELKFRLKPTLGEHHAIIGMATVVDNYPLYYDAANEYGLSMAGLNFPQNAHYFSIDPQKDNIAPFEFIPWILSQCRTLDDVRPLLERINLCDIPFSEAFPLSPLHWIIADRNGALTVESTADGLNIYDNPVGVLTNNPRFEYHLTHLCDYSNLSPYSPESNSVPLYSRGMGAIGLPGDFSSASRFVRVAFAKRHAIADKGNDESGISQFFHILGTVEQPRGCVYTDDGRPVISVYTSCINTDTGVYHYKTYDNQQICAVDMHRCDLDRVSLYAYPLITDFYIHRQN